MTDLIVPSSGDECKVTCCPLYICVCLKSLKVRLCDFYKGGTTLPEILY